MSFFARNSNLNILLFLSKEYLICDPGTDMGYGRLRMSAAVLTVFPSESQSTPRLLVTPGEAVLVRPIHHPLTLLGAPIIWTTRVRNANTKLGQELSPTNLLKLLIRSSENCRPEDIVGEIPLPPDVFLRAIQKEGEVVMPGHY